MRHLKNSEKGITYLEVLVSIVIVLMALQIMGMGINFYSEIKRKNQNLERATYDAERLLRDVSHNLSYESIVEGDLNDVNRLKERYEDERYGYSVALIPMDTLWLERDIKAGIITEGDFEHAKYFASEGGVSVDTVCQQFTDGELAFSVNKQDCIQAKEGGLKYLIIVTVNEKGEEHLGEPKILKQMMGVKQVYAKN